MSETIDALRLKVTSEVDAKAIDLLTGALKGLQSASSGSNIGNLAKQMTQLSDACGKLQAVTGRLYSLTASLSLLDDIKGTGINSVANGLKKLPEALKAIQNLNMAATARDIEFLTSALWPLNELDGSGIRSIANGLGKLPDALKGINDVDVDKLTDQIQRLTTALSPLAAVMRDIADGGKELNTTFKNVTITTKSYASANKTASNNVGDLSGSVSTLTRKLTSLLVKIAATVGGFRAISNAISDGIVNSMDYIENLNLFTVSMGRYADSQKRYAETVSDIMGIDPSEWMRNEGVFNNMLEGFGIGTDDAAWMSQNLTGLLYDYASFYNLSIEQAAQKITSAISGELEPVRRQGFDLSQAALTQLAQDPKWYGTMSYTIDQNTGALIGNSEAWTDNSQAVIANYNDMTQAEKAQLRYIALLTQNSDMVGDFARTLEDPANQLRIFKNNMTMVSRALGNIFIPALNKVMPYLIAGAQVLKDILNTIAELMGFQLPDMSSRVSLDGSTVGGYEDVEDAIDGAAGSAKKLKDYMIGIDELNVLNNNDNGGGSGSGAGYASDLSYALPGYDFIGDATNSKIEQIKAQIEALINDTEHDFRAWGERIGDILNGILVKWEDPFKTGLDVGNGLSDILKVADGIVIEFDWTLAGKDLGEMIMGYFNSDITYEIPNLTLDVVKGAIRFASALITNVNVFEVADNVTEGITEAIMKDYSDEYFGGHFENGVWYVTADSDLTLSIVDYHVDWSKNHPISSWLGDQIANLLGIDYVDREGNYLADVPIVTRITLASLDDPISKQLLSYFTGQQVTREILIRTSIEFDTNTKTWIKENIVDPIRNALLEAIGTVAEAIGDLFHLEDLETWGADLVANATNTGTHTGNGAQGNGGIAALLARRNYNRDQNNAASRRNTDMGSYYASQYSQQSQQTRQRRAKNAEDAGREVVEYFVKGINANGYLITNAGIESGNLYGGGANSTTGSLYTVGTNLKDTLTSGAGAGLYETMYVKGTDGGKGYNTGVESWRGKIGDTGRSIKSTLVDNMGGNLYGLLHDAGSNGVAGFSDAFKDSPHINTLINNAKAVAQSAIDAVKDTLGVHSPSVVMKDIGEQTVTGLSNGLSDATPGLVNKIKDTVTTAANTAAGTAKGTLTKALRIKSPSRVFEEIGAYTAEGFNIGFTDEAEETYKIMNGYAKKLSSVSMANLYVPTNNAMPTGINPNIAAQAQANSTAAMAAMALAMYEGVNGAMANRNGNERDINLKVMINGREVFYAVREEERKNGYEVSNGAFGG